MYLKFLGSADSGGIPTHNCSCIICEEYREAGRKNLSNSAYIELDSGEIILLDAGIEAISDIFDGKKIRAIFLTHFHPDHALGLLRLRYSKEKMPCFHPKDEKGFADLFKHTKSIEYHENTPFEVIKIDDLLFTPLPLYHSKNTTGYLIESPSKTIAYLTDCGGIPEESMHFLQSKKIDICYIDAALAPNFSNGNHLNFEEAIETLDRIGAEKSHLMHTSHYTLEYIKEHGIKLKYGYIDEGHEIAI